MEEVIYPLILGFESVRECVFVSSEDSESKRALR